MKKWMIEFDPEQRCPCYHPEQFGGWCSILLLRASWEDRDKTNCPGLGQPGCPAKSADIPAVTHKAKELKCGTK